MTTTSTMTLPCGQVLDYDDYIAATNMEECEDGDDLGKQLRQEALDALREEPELTMLLHNTILAPGVKTFEDMVATAITYRILLKPCQTTPSLATEQQNNNGGGIPVMFCPNSLRGILANAMHSSTVTEAGHTMSEAVRLDALAVCERDPAVDSLLEVVLFMKGFAALVCHRAAYYKWHTTTRRQKKSITSLWLQSQASAVFGVDIHPAATMGAGIMLDHATGIVVGETATVGDGCTLLHGVTLGGTGKDSGDRHPKVGKYVLIGANASLLGNIHIGDGSKIGAGSVVLRSIPSGATAVGAPAKIIGRAKEAKPGSTMDETLLQVSQISGHHNKNSSDATRKSIRSTDSNNNDTDSTAQETSSNSGNTSSSESEEGFSGDSSENNHQDHISSSLIEKVPSISTTHEEQQQQHHQQKQKQLRKKVSNGSCTEDPCCPFRDYLHLSNKAPKGTINLSTLRRFLSPEGCSSSDIFELLFAMDTNTKGYIRPDKFFSPGCRDLILEKTHIAQDRLESLIKGWQEQIQQECALLHQLEDQTREIKKKSHKHSVQAVAVSS